MHSSDIKLRNKRKFIEEILDQNQFKSLNDSYTNYVRAPLGYDIFKCLCNRPKYFKSKSNR